MGWIIAGVVISGLIANYLLLSHEMRKSPEGGMGMGLFLFIGLIPWSLPLLFCIGFIVGFIADLIQRITNP